MITRSGAKRVGQLDGLRDGAGLGDDLEALAPVEQRDEPLAHDLVVVDHEQPQRMPGVAGSPAGRRSLGSRVSHALVSSAVPRSTAAARRPRACPRRPLSMVSGAAQGLGPSTHVAQPVVARPRTLAGVEAAPIVDDDRRSMVATIVDADR